MAAQRGAITAGAHFKSHFCPIDAKANFEMRACNSF